MAFEDSWRADWEAGSLHISGTTDLFPNDFSTASLRREDALGDSHTVTYRLVFHRDKEPFSDKTGVGGVHYWERSAPPSARLIRIILPENRGSIEFAVPRRPGPGAV